MEGNSFNSTRLSLEIAHLPLTPFGMNHRGSVKKKQQFGSPSRVTKLSLKKSPLHDGKENNPLPEAGIGSRGKVASIPTKSSFLADGQGHTQMSRGSCRSLATVFEDESVSNRVDYCNNSESNSVAISNGQSSKGSSQSSGKRDSLYTDVDDGSFVEFFDGEVAAAPVQEVDVVPIQTKEHDKDSQQSFYTCKSQDDTVFSTSTKNRAAVIGFQQFIDRMRTKKQLHNIEEETVFRNVEDDSRNHMVFPADETIICGSADIMSRKSILKRTAVNSTMIREFSEDNCFSFPDISSLTVQTDAVSVRDSRKLTQHISPSNNGGNITVVLESSESSCSCSSTDPNHMDDKAKPYDDLEADNELERTNSYELPYIKRRNVISADAPVPERDKPTGIPLRGKEIFFTPNSFTSSQYHSFISEDISIIDSAAGRGTGSYSDPVANSKMQSQNYRSSNEEAKNKNLQLEEELGMESSIPSTINHVKSPDVVKWVLTSPFKEGSFVSSFLQKHDTLDTSETPSCPKSRNVENNLVVWTPSPANSPPKFSCVKEVDQMPGPSVVLCRNDGAAVPQCTGMKSTIAPRKAKNGNYEIVDGPLTANWVMTSPLEEGSLPSSFLQQEDVTDITQRLSQSGSEKSWGSSESCEKSLRLRLAERVRSSHSSPLSNEGNGKEIESYSPGYDRTERQSRDGSTGTELRILNSFVNVGKRKNYKNASCAGESVSEIFSEDTESLHLRLSEMHGGSQEHSEKSLYTIGKDAAFPNSPNPLNSELNESFIKRKVGTTNKLRISDSDESDESYLDTSLPDLTERLKTRNSPKHISKKCISVKPKSSELTSSLRPERTSRKKINYYTSDEDSSSNEYISADKGGQKCKNYISESEEEIPTSSKQKQKKDYPTYHVNDSNEDTNSDDSQSSFENYLKSVKKQIQKETDNVRATSWGNKYDGSFIDDESDEDDFSFYLPSLSKRLDCNVLTEESHGSISKDLRTRVSKKLHDQKLAKKKEIEPKTTTKSTKKSVVKNNVTNKHTWRNSRVLDSSTDSDSDILPEKDDTQKKTPSQSFVTPNHNIKSHATSSNKTVTVSSSNKNILSKPTSKTDNFIKSSQRKLKSVALPTKTFLASLSSNIDKSQCHPDATPYVKNFKKTKEDLCQKLYIYYNKHVFDQKLPDSMNMKWNPRMTKTAGFCYYQIDRSKPSGRGARIELSSKVIDVPERLRDTLIHEICHAAAWIISGYKDGHGPLWKAWAAKAKRTFPELPPITTCHSYEISCKYTYRCTGCSYSIGRHSKSLNTEQKVCGYCHGKFELIVNSKGKGRGQSSSSTPGTQTPRTPNGFALFVKDNYSSIKKSKQGLSHAAVMRLLSADFSKMKAGSN